MGKVWLVRHGVTNYNHKNEEYRASGEGTSQAPYRWQIEYSDLPLSEAGLAQSTPAIAAAHQLDVQRIFVSPLRRALQTAKMLFEEHPNRPSFHVFPVLHEIIHNSHDVSLLDGEPFPEYAHYDWSQVPFDGTHLARHVIANQHTAQLEGMPYREAAHKLLEVMKELNPNYVEDEDTEGFQRAQGSREFFLNQPDNICLVGHSTFFQKFTEQRLADGRTEGTRFLKNCEILEYV